MKIKKLYGIALVAVATAVTYLAVNFGTVFASHGGNWGGPS